VKASSAQPWFYSRGDRGNKQALSLTAKKTAGAADCTSELKHTGRWSRMPRPGKHFRANLLSGRWHLEDLRQKIPEKISSNDCLCQSWTAAKPSCSRGSHIQAQKVQCLVLPMCILLQEAISFVGLSMWRCDVVRELECRSSPCSSSRESSCGWSRKHITTLATNLAKTHTLPLLEADVSTHTLPHL